MYFKSIELHNFRNYSSLRCEFDRGLNLFLGQNAQGKTNLLESLFIMGLGRSFRTNSDREMIAFGSDSARAFATVAEDGYPDSTIEIVYSGEGKVIKTDGVRLERTIDLLEHVYVVVFAPDDLNIIKDGPESRRRFLDRELCQIKPVYYSDLGNYKKVLKQRNMLLRQGCSDRTLLDVFDESLADYGLRLCDERTRFAKKLQEISSRIHADITEGKEQLTISYETKLAPSCAADRESRKAAYREQLLSHFEADLQRGYTGFGPHKDDLKIEIGSPKNTVDARLYGSQGQQRTAALSLKLAEIGLIKDETGKNAVLLLDDVLSELDRNRQRCMIEAMRGVQVFITATQIDGEVLRLLPKGKSFHIEDGKLLT